MNEASTLRFTAEHLEAFLAFSRDRSPLHDDADYAARTPYGEVVVPGMCGVVSALRTLDGVPWRRLRGVFKAPLFLNRDYALQVTRSGNDTTVVISRGATVHAEIVVMADAADAAASDPSEPAYREKATSYEPDMAALDALRHHSAMRANSISVDRLSALGWASYFVGMVYPGRQAALLSFDLSFAEAADAGARVSFDRLAGYFDDRFNRVTIHGSGQPLRAIVLQAVVRPERVTYTLEEVAAAMTPAHQWWRDKAVVVSGGTRGLGSALTRALLLAGSRVLFTYVRSTEDARAIEAEAGRLNTTALPCQVDLTLPMAADTLTACAARLGGIDAVINNATLPIRSEAFHDQSADDFRDYVSRSTAMIESVYRATLPLMNPGGSLVCISSSYVSAPRAGFSHYITAKTAIEGLTRALAVEHPELRFVIARPGRMRTDQTNVPISLESSMPATTAAASLLTALASSATTSGTVHELDLQEP